MKQLSKPMPMRSFIVPSLLSVHAVLLFYSSRLHSVTIDEGAHIASGLSHWNTGNFAAYRVNPPLARFVASLPVLIREPVSFEDGAAALQDPFRRAEWHLWDSFFKANRHRLFDFVFPARWAGILWSCIGGWFLYRWCRDLYGEGAGLLGLCLWCFEPNVMAHAQLATPDLPCTVAGLVAMYTFRHYLMAPAWPGAVLCGLALGLALLTKFTLLALIPGWVVLLLCAQRGLPNMVWRTRVLMHARHFGLVLGSCLIVVNMGYAFQGTGKRLGDYQFISRMFAGPSAVLDKALGSQGSGNRFRETWLGYVPVPLPEDYLRGIDVQRRDFEEMHKQRPSYLGGEWAPYGWWYYYLYALAVKLPVGLIVLAVCGIVLALPRYRELPTWREELILYLPAITILALVSSQTGFSHHLRYVLPVLPFFIIGTGKVASLLRPDRYLAGAMVIALLLWTVGSSLVVYPHSLSYFNEPAGGPQTGHAHLLDSNIDWGQDSLFLKRWLDEHPEARPMEKVLFGYVHWTSEEEGKGPHPERPVHRDPYDFGPRPGYFAISVNYLRGMPMGSSVPAHAYEYMQRFRPIGRAGYSIYIYHITPEEAEEARKQMGLAPLASYTAEP